MISERLEALLRDACHQVDSAIVGTLHHEIVHGRYPWFFAEFSEAIRSGAFTRVYWGRLIGADYDPEDHDETEEDLREIWEIVFPEHQFPTDRSP